MALPLSQPVPERPTILFGRTANTLWHDCANGDLIVDVRGKIAHFHREPGKSCFLFQHDSLLDGAEAGLVTDATLDGQGTFHAFRTGPVRWRVVDHHTGLDVYRAIPGHRDA